MKILSKTFPKCRYSGPKYVSECVFIISKPKKIQHWENTTIWGHEILNVIVLCRGCGESSTSFFKSYTESSEKKNTHLRVWIWSWTIISMHLGRYLITKSITSRKNVSNFRGLDLRNQEELEGRTGCFEKFRVYIFVFWTFFEVGWQADNHIFCLKTHTKVKILILWYLTNADFR